MLLVGERNYALLRLLSALSGYRQSDNRLPERFHQPLQGGPGSSCAIDKQIFDQTLSEYDRLRGYDNYGPTDATLERLCLGDYVGTIHREQRSQPSV